MARNSVPGKYYGRVIGAREPREESVSFDVDMYRGVVAGVRAGYNRLSVDYDLFYPAVTLKQSRFIADLHKYLRDHGVRRLLDCACGTGRELIPLAETGYYVELVGSDLSPKMVAAAKRKSGSRAITWVCSDWLTLGEKLKGDKFDAVLCLGNPLAHIPSWAYERVFSVLATLLVDDGRLIINRRNVEAELGKSAFRRGRPHTTVFLRVPRISLLNSGQADGGEFLTYFTYHDYDDSSRLVVANVMLSKNDGKVAHRAYPFRCYFEDESTMRRALLAAGFGRIEDLEHSVHSNGFDSYAEEMLFAAVK